MPASLPLASDLNILHGSRLFGLYGDARASLARTDWLVSACAHPAQLTSALVFKEALQSSLIEGIRTSATAMLSYRALRRSYRPVKKRPTEEDVSNCVDAMAHAAREFTPGHGISLAPLLEAHRILMAGERNRHKQPGQLRTVQNWISAQRQLRFVPPPPGAVAGLMSDLLKYINSDGRGVDPLLRTAIAHLQFESIHPFVDGNGRIGRLLIHETLRRFSLLERPALCISGYLHKHRARYFELLRQVNEEGDWEEWLDYFLVGVIESGQATMVVSERIDRLIAADIDKLSGIKGNVSRVYQAMLLEGVASVKQLTFRTSLTPTSVARCLEKLQELGIIGELTDQKRNRLFIYRRYVEIIDKKFC